MNIHPRSKLGPAGRLALTEAIASGVSQKAAAAAFCVAPATSQGAGQLSNPQALTDGFSAAFLGAAGIAIAGALLALVTLRQPPQASEPASAEGPARVSVAQLPELPASAHDQRPYRRHRERAQQ